MKEQAIGRINRMDKIGQIVSVVCLVLLGIGLLAIVSAMIATAFLPKGLVTLRVGGTMEVRADMAAIGHRLSPEDIARIEDVTGYRVSIGNGGNLLENIKATETTVTAKGSAEGISVDVRSLSWRLLPALLTVAMAIVSVCFAMALCKAFARCASPFEDNVVKKLRALAFSLIPWTVLTSLAQNAAILGIKQGFSLSVDLGMVLAVLIILALAYIFKYGAVLQRESDETL